MNNPEHFGYRIRFAFTRRWLNPKLKCLDLAACSELLNPIKFSDQKTPANPSILTLLINPEKKNGCKRSHCWETDINPLNPNVKIEILICYLYTFSIEVVGRIC